MKDLDQWIEDNVNIWAIDSVQDIKELLVLFSDNQKREQFVDFLIDIEECYGMDDKEKTEKFVDDYLRNKEIKQQ